MTDLRRKEVSENDAWNTRYGLEGPLWASARAFLVPVDVICMRTTRKVECSRVVRALAELYFFVKKDAKNALYALLKGQA